MDKLLHGATLMGVSRATYWRWKKKYPGLTRRRLINAYHREKQKKQDEREEKRKAQELKKIGFRYCKICGKMFHLDLDLYHSKGYCSDECKQVQMRALWRKEKRRQRARLKKN